VTDASVVTHTQSVVLENVRVNGTRVDLLQTMQPVRKS
jgi:hypothetical protein